MKYVANVCPLLLFCCDAGTGAARTDVRGLWTIATRGKLSWVLEKRLGWIWVVDCG